jgi:enterochelin esterase-like enzyme
VFLVVLAVSIAAVMAGTAFVWNRGRRLRHIRNVTLLLLGQLLTAALLLTAVNIHEQFYSSWGEVFGVNGPGGIAVVSAGPALRLLTPRSTSTVLGRAGPGALDQRLTQARKAHHGQGSLVTDITVAGKRTGYRWKARAYLPQAYFSPADAHRTFPVVEMFPGGGGGRASLFGALPLQQAFDQAIAAGTLPPLIAIAPTRNPVRIPDMQCLDNPGGFKTFTYLADDVPAALHSLLRVRRDRAGWVTLGNSSGGFCAANVAMQRPRQFATVVSLSGYFSGPLSQFPMGDPLRGRAQQLANSPLHQLASVRLPMNFIVVSARDDVDAMREIGLLVTTLAAHPTDHEVTITTPTGGHSSIPWRATLPTMLAALGRILWHSGGHVTFRPCAVPPGTGHAPAPSATSAAESAVDSPRATRAAGPPVLR